MPLYFYLVTIATAVVGFAIAFYIQEHKRTDQKMLCPLHSDCDKVVRSQYSRFLGAPLEQWGMVYYGLVGLIYLGLLLKPAWAYQPLVASVALATVFAFLFSLYLTYIQMAKLREWCAWCLTSALCSAIIFLALVGNWLAV